MALGDRTWKWAAKTAWGYPFNYLKGVIEHVFGYTHYGKKVSAGTSGAVLASTPGTTSTQTITAVTNPDVPRVLAITIGGSGFSNDSVVINGTNVEGKTIADTIAYSGTGQVIGSLVFKTVTSVVLKGTLGASATVTVDTTNRLGINHRLQPSFGTIVVIQDNQLEEYVNRPVAQAAPSASNLDNQLVEKNWVQPATTPDGTTFLYIFYWEHKIKVQPPTDSPDFYSTTTSTSTSSTSSSTSTSSTSSSLSTSSTSVSSTSSSTSSTSTSTTTLPI